MAEEQTEKKVGVVTHYFPKVGAAVVKFETEAKVGDKVKIKGSRGEKHESIEFEQAIESMQKDHVPVESAKIGDELGMKVGQEVREGDEVFIVK